MRRSVSHGEEIFSQKVGIVEGKVGGAFLPRLRSTPSVLAEFTTVGWPLRRNEASKA